eukprot:tig00021518_g22030.t1
MLQVVQAALLNKAGTNAVAANTPEAEALCREVIRQYLQRMAEEKLTGSERRRRRRAAREAVDATAAGAEQLELRTASWEDDGRMERQSDGTPSSNWATPAGSSGSASPMSTGTPRGREPMVTDGAAAGLAQTAQPDGTCDDATDPLHGPETATVNGAAVGLAQTAQPDTTPVNTAATETGPTDPASELARNAQSESAPLSTFFTSVLERARRSFAALHIRLQGEAVMPEEERTAARQEREEDDPGSGSEDAENDSLDGGPLRLRGGGGSNTPTPDGGDDAFNSEAVQDVIDPMPPLTALPAPVPLGPGQIELLGVAVDPAEMAAAEEQDDPPPLWRSDDEARGDPDSDDDLYPPTGTYPNGYDSDCSSTAYYPTTMLDIELADARAAAARRGVTVEQHLAEQLAEAEAALDRPQSPSDVWAGVAARMSPGSERAPGSISTYVDEWLLGIAMTTEANPAADTATPATPAAATVLRARARLLAGRAIADRAARHRTDARDTQRELQGDATARDDVADQVHDGLMQPAVLRLIAQEAARRVIGARAVDRGTTYQAAQQTIRGDVTAERELTEAVLADLRQWRQTGAAAEATAAVTEACNTPMLYTVYDTTSGFLNPPQQTPTLIAPPARLLHPGVMPFGSSSGTSTGLYDRTVEDVLAMQLAGLLDADGQPTATADADRDQTRETDAAEVPYTPTFAEGRTRVEIIANLLRAVENRLETMPPPPPLPHMPPIHYVDDEAIIQGQAETIVDAIIATLRHRVDDPRTELRRRLGDELSRWTGGPYIVYHNRGQIARLHAAFLRALDRIAIMQQCRPPPPPRPRHESDDDEDDLNGFGPSDAATKSNAGRTAQTTATTASGSGRRRPSPLEEVDPLETLLEVFYQAKLAVHATTDAPDTAGTVLRLRGGAGKRTRSTAGISSGEDDPPRQRPNRPPTPAVTDPALGLAQSAQAVMTTASAEAAELQRVEKLAPAGEQCLMTAEAAETQRAEGAETPPATDPTFGLAQSVQAVTAASATEEDAKALAPAGERCPTAAEAAETQRAEGAETPPATDPTFGLAQSVQAVTAASATEEDAKALAPAGERCPTAAEAAETQRAEGAETPPATDPTLGLAQSVQAVTAASAMEEDAKALAPAGERCPTAAEAAETQRAEGAETPPATDPTFGLAQSVQAVTAASATEEDAKAFQLAPAGERCPTAAEAAETQRAEGAETPPATDPTLGLAQSVQAVTAASAMEEDAKALAPAGERCPTAAEAAETQRAEGAETPPATDPTFGLAQSVQAVTAASATEEDAKALAPVGERCPTAAEAAETQRAEGAETPPATDPTLGLAQSVQAVTTEATAAEPGGDVVTTPPPDAPQEHTYSPNSPSHPDHPMNITRMEIDSPSEHTHDEAEHTWEANYRRRLKTGQTINNDTRYRALAEYTMDKYGVPRSSNVRRQVADGLMRNMDPPPRTAPAHQALHPGNAELIAELTRADAGELLNAHAGPIDERWLGLWGRLTSDGRWRLLQWTAMERNVDTATLAAQEHRERAAKFAEIQAAGGGRRMQEVERGEEPRAWETTVAADVARAYAVHRGIDKEMSTAGIGDGNVEEALRSLSSREAGYYRVVSRAVFTMLGTNTVWNPQWITGGRPGGPPPTHLPRSMRPKERSMMDYEFTNPSQEEGVRERQIWQHLAPLMEAVKPWVGLTDTARFGALAAEADKRRVSVEQLPDILIEEWGQLCDLARQAGYLRWERVATGADNPRHQHVAVADIFVQTLDLLGRLDHERDRYHPGQPWFKVFRALAAEEAGYGKGRRARELYEQLATLRDSVTGRAETETLLKMYRGENGWDGWQYRLPHATASVEFSTVYTSRDLNKTRTGERPYIDRDLTEPFRMDTELPRRDFSIWMARQSRYVRDGKSLPSPPLSRHWGEGAYGTDKESLVVTTQVEVQAALLHAKLPQFRRAMAALIMTGFSGFVDPFVEAPERRCSGEISDAAWRDSARQGLSCLGHDSLLALFGVEMREIGHFTNAVDSIMPTLVALGIELGRRLNGERQRRGRGAPIQFDTGLLEKALTSQAMDEAVEEATRYVMLAAATMETPPALEECPDAEVALRLRTHAITCGLSLFLAARDPRAEGGLQCPRTLWDSKGSEVEWVDVLNTNRAFDYDLPDGFLVTFLVEICESFLTVARYARTIDGRTPTIASVAAAEDNESRALFTRTRPSLRTGRTNVNLEALSWSTAFRTALGFTGKAHLFCDLMEELLYVNAMAVDVPFRLVDGDLRDGARREAIATYLRQRRVIPVHYRFVSRESKTRAIVHLTYSAGLARLRRDHNVIRDSIAMLAIELHNDREEGNKPNAAFSWAPQPPQAPMHLAIHDPDVTWYAAPFQSTPFILGRRGENLRLVPIAVAMTSLRTLLLRTVTERLRESMTTAIATATGESDPHSAKAQQAVRVLTSWIMEMAASPFKAYTVAMIVGHPMQFFTLLRTLHREQLQHGNEGLQRYPLTPNRQLPVVMQGRRQDWERNIPLHHLPVRSAKPGAWPYYAGANAFGLPTVMEGEMNETERRVIVHFALRPAPNVAGPSGGSATTVATLSPPQDARPESAAVALVASGDPARINTSRRPAKPHEVTAVDMLLHGGPLAQAVGKQLQHGDGALTADDRAIQQDLFVPTPLPRHDVDTDPLLLRDQPASGYFHYTTWRRLHERAEPVDGAIAAAFESQRARAPRIQGRLFQQAMGQLLGQPTGPRARPGEERAGAPSARPLAEAPQRRRRRQQPQPEDQPWERYDALGRVCINGDELTLFTDVKAGTTALQSRFEYRAPTRTALAWQHPSHPTSAEELTTDHGSVFDPARDDDIHATMVFEVQLPTTTERHWLGTDDGTGHDLLLGFSHVPDPHRELTAVAHLASCFATTALRVHLAFPLVAWLLNALTGLPTSVEAAAHSCNLPTGLGAYDILMVRETKLRQYVCASDTLRAVMMREIAVWYNAGTMLSRVVAFLQDFNKPGVLNRHDWPCSTELEFQTADPRQVHVAPQIYPCFLGDVCVHPVPSEHFEHYSPTNPQRTPLEPDVGREMFPIDLQNEVMPPARVTLSSKTREGQQRFQQYAVQQNAFTQRLLGLREERSEFPAALTSFGHFVGAHGVIISSGFILAAVMQLHASNPRLSTPMPAEVADHIQQRCCYMTGYPAYVEAVPEATESDMCDGTYHVQPALMNFLTRHGFTCPEPSVFAESIRLGIMQAATFFRGFRFYKPRRPVDPCTLDNMIAVPVMRAFTITADGDGNQQTHVDASQLEEVADRFALIFDRWWSMGEAHEGAALDPLHTSLFPILLDEMLQGENSALWTEFTTWLRDAYGDEALHITHAGPLVYHEAQAGPEGHPEGVAEDTSLRLRATNPLPYYLHSAPKRRGDAFIDCSLVGSGARELADYTVWIALPPEPEAGGTGDDDDDGADGGDGGQGGSGRGPRRRRAGRTQRPPPSTDETSSQAPTSATSEGSKRARTRMGRKLQRRLAASAKATVGTTGGAPTASSTTDSTYGGSTSTTTASSAATTMSSSASVYSSETGDTASSVYVTAPSESEAATTAPRRVARALIPTSLRAIAKYMLSIDYTDLQFVTFLQTATRWTKYHGSGQLLLLAGAGASTTGEGGAWYDRDFVTQVDAIDWTSLRLSHSLVYTRMIHLAAYIARRTARWAVDGTDSRSAARKLEVHRQAVFYVTVVSNACGRTTRETLLAKRVPRLVPAAACIDLPKEAALTAPDTVTWYTKRILSVTPLEFDGIVSQLCTFINACTDASCALPCDVQNPVCVATVDRRLVARMYEGRTPEAELRRIPDLIHEVQSDLTVLQGLYETTQRIQKELGRPARNSDLALELAVKECVIVSAFEHPFRQLRFGEGPQRRPTLSQRAGVGFFGKRASSDSAQAGDSSEDDRPAPPATPWRSTRAHRRVLRLAAANPAARQMQLLHPNSITTSADPEFVFHPASLPLLTRVLAVHTDDAGTPTTTVSPVVEALAKELAEGISRTVGGEVGKLLAERLVASAVKRDQNAWMDRLQATRLLVECGIAALGANGWAKESILIKVIVDSGAEVDVLDGSVAEMIPGLTYLNERVPLVGFQSNITTYGRTAHVVLTLGPVRLARTVVVTSPNSMGDVKMLLGLSTLIALRAQISCAPEMWGMHITSPDDQENHFVPFRPRTEPEGPFRSAFSVPSTYQEAKPSYGAMCRTCGASFRFSKTKSASQRSARPTRTRLTQL